MEGDANEKKYAKPVFASKDHEDLFKEMIGDIEKNYESLKNENTTQH